MNKNEFLKQLDFLLSDFPEDERREAMEYYVEYFDEAGPEKEDEVLKELGSPQEVANHIREELSGKGLIPADASASGQEKTSGWKIACIVLLCLLAAPIAIPLAIAAVALIVSVITAIVSSIAGVFLAACGVTFALAIAAIVLFIVGIIKLFISPLVGFLLIGISLTFAGTALLLGFLVVQFCIVVLPAICRGIYKLCKHIFVKKEKEAEA
ncbi:MAG: DUF1700 domain-containing protein [Lachnospiraceae bacterium]|nr:DUF1700 domain-containing protein [Lachnospiraceae bacterium]